MHYKEELLPCLLEDCRTSLGHNFIFQQDGAPAHTSHLAQTWLQQQCRDLIDKAEWPPNSPDLNPLDFCVWGIMLERYERYSPRPRNISELKTALQVIWDSLPLEVIQKAVMSFRKRLQACIWRRTLRVPALLVLTLSSSSALFRANKEINLKWLKTVFLLMTLLFAARLSVVDF